MAFAISWVCAIMSAFFHLSILLQEEMSSSRHLVSSGSQCWKLLKRVGVGGKDTCIVAWSEVSAAEGSETDVVMESIAAILGP